MTSPGVDGSSEPGTIRRSGPGFSAGPLAVGLVFVLALNLRPALTALGPLLPQIGPDQELSEAMQGLLGALPLLTFAAVSSLVHRVSGRFGVERAVLAGLVLLTAGLLIRSYAGAPGLWIGTAIIGCAIAICNVLVPAILRRDFPLRVSRATGIYSACMTLGAGLGSALAVPLSFLIGWRGALAIWAVLAAAVAALWIGRARRDGPPAPAQRSAGAPRGESVWRWPTAWLLTGFFGMQGTVFYTVTTWLPTILTANGLSESQAGIELSIFQVVGIFAGLAIPRLMGSSGSLIAAAVTVSVPMIVGPLGLLFLPALSLLWVAVSGLGTGAALVVALALISIRGRSGHETAKLSGMAQSVGYLLAAGGPTLAGLLAQQTDGWTAPLIMLAAFGVGVLAFGIAAGRKSSSPRGG